MLRMRASLLEMIELLSRTISPPYFFYYTINIKQKKEPGPLRWNA